MDESMNLFQMMCLIFCCCLFTDRVNDVQTYRHMYVWCTTDCVLPFDGGLIFQYIYLFIVVLIVIVVLSSFLSM